MSSRVAEVAWEHGWHPPKSLDSDENFKPEHTLFCRELRFVAIYALFLPKDLQKVRKLRQILICDKIAYVWALHLRLSPNFSAGATRAPVQLLPPCIQLKFKHGNGLSATKCHLVRIKLTRKLLPLLYHRQKSHKSHSQVLQNQN